MDCWRLESRWSQRYFDDPLLEECFRILRPGEVRRLAESGMTIGAHTLSHPMLSQQSNTWAQTEIAASRQLLRDCSNQPVWAMAYPFGNEGAVGARESQLAENAGYQCAFMNIEGELDRANKFFLPRVHVTSEMTPDVFEAHVSGLHEMLRSRAPF
ncbi:MAG TPA: polysaccharide deacetylase family protein [Candidatus Sulfotelmatobacter sp.]|nr:polysaccharide deacetylase family protein [Candidatus Sulfotelmatobacter sp.]